MTCTDFLAAAALAAFGLMPGAAAADAIALDASIEGASLHEGGVDMAIYYVDRGDHFEVVATYAAVEAPSRPARIRMGLADGDSTTFGLPGMATPRLYTFSREGETVTVETTRIGADFAQMGR